MPCGASMNANWHDREQTDLPILSSQCGPDHENTVSQQSHSVVHRLRPDSAHPQRQGTSGACLGALCKQAAVHLAQHLLHLGALHHTILCTAARDHTAESASARRSFSWYTTACFARISYRFKNPINAGRHLGQFGRGAGGQRLPMQSHSQTGGHAKPTAAAACSPTRLSTSPACDEANVLYAMARFSR